MGAGFAFDIEIRRGGGAYICGEETALLESIEGRRGEPRRKPPFPVEAGLYGQPTVINNVETLINIPGIILDGGTEYVGPRHPGVQRPQAVQHLRPRRAARRLRGGVRPHAARPDRARGRGPGWARRQDRQPGRRGRGLRGPRGDGRAAHLRAREGDRRDAGRRGRRRVRRDHRHRGHPAADRRVLPRRVLRPVRPVPRGDRPPGGAAGAAGGAAARRDARRTSWRCSRISGRCCATPRSAASARRPTTPCEPACASRRCRRDRSSPRSRVRQGPYTGVDPVIFTHQPGPLAGPAHAPARAASRRPSS